ncbi:MAG: UDP-N-acetylglucosamine 1-carboxyvinyltransferase, partial [Chloroflexota bacterium]|nr:UDP-N-acetylglucosamine 1-carboxyvinyltransferase [Chloroflexota bacterium]
VEVQSMPHPGFPTDKQAEMGALLTQASGRSTISDRVFENRFGYLDGLQRLGAKIDRRESHALIAGPQQLRGAQVELERDLRAGAALTIAALVAEGQSVLSGVSFIDRGYEDLAGDLAALGADIRVARQ